ncbi:DUF4112 domain-containing protein [Dermatophilus congolensis]|uniref:DUF4112 domain-containing protein n=1 Tax=Dermatophilus congolensis TaxID=1863 RepID=UPI001D1FD494|nr:DUF4112 domain-containing protein [Dermatophilus congolensis]MBO3143537.1 DUF4112 domain-containing protein [Dermatophilus congolensis]MBO3152528.1 DUF4112 domain-containing protein [Dermatophilus congolensis]MBO3160461.1 DUF4112 domain-containing protein [Dermatophilus congolensis]MBO3163814.1 DUF4112 domain-containing protein [Dermatophilus congolensis]MBO3177360.1 DUF4112 domain-containing protein [Dermatophilus congolensis]
MTSMPKHPSDSSSTPELDLLAWLLDDLIRIPGIRMRIGADALIGLIPGAGDVLGTALGGAILIGAVRQRVPMSTLLRMGWNLFIDQILGLIPGVGDIADFAHRANSKNVQLLRRDIAEGRTVSTDTRGYLIRAAFLVGVILCVLIVFTGIALWFLWRLVSTLLGL